MFCDGINFTIPHDKKERGTRQGAPLSIFSRPLRTQAGPWQAGAWHEGAWHAGA
jgi:hypothetical protein